MRDSISAKVSIRIAPEKFPEFEKAISAPPVEVSYRNESAVDQTLPLIDAEKRLEVKILLRDRLTAMLREPGQKSPADMAEIERKIAEVQGEIESATARRDYLRTVTQTVRVDISYYSVSAKVSGVNFSPVAASVRGGGPDLHQLGGGADRLFSLDRAVATLCSARLLDRALAAPPWQARLAVSVRLPKGVGPHPGRASQGEFATVMQGAGRPRKQQPQPALTRLAICASYGPAGKRFAQLIGPGLLDNAAFKQVAENVCGHLIDAIGIILDFTGAPSSRFRAICIQIAVVPSSEARKIPRLPSSSIKSAFDFLIGYPVG